MDSATSRSRSRNTNTASPWLGGTNSRGSFHGGIKGYIRECNSLGTIPVSYFQRHVHDTEFVMRHHGLGPLGAKAIGRPLEINTRIEKLDLEGNNIKAEGALYLARSLLENVAITELILSENRIGSQGAAAIIEMIRGNGHITHVDLSGNGIHDADGRIFFYLLKHGRCLQSVALRHNSLSMVSAFWLKKALEMNDTLRVLDLSWNHLRLQGAIDIGSALKENISLKELNLHMNGFGREGVLAISGSLAVNDSLEWLDISSNRILSEGALGISRALSKNTTLKTLRIGNNPIEPAGCFAILAALDSNPDSVVNLVHMENLIVNEDFEALHESMLKKGHILRVVHGGVVRRKTHEIVLDDIEVEYLQDPMSKLRDYCTKHQIRMIDLFKRFDRDQSWTITPVELKKGVKSSGIDMEEQEIEDLIQTLDTDNTGKIDYQELIVGDGQSRQERRKVTKKNKEIDQQVKDSPVCSLKQQQEPGTKI